MPLKYLPAFAALFVMVAQPLAAAERIELAPSSNWVINYDAESCALQRDFGEDGQKVFLELRSFAPSSSTSWQTMVASQDFALSEEKMKFAIEPFAADPAELTSYDISLAETYKGRLFDASLESAPELIEGYQHYVATTSDLTEDERALVIRGLNLDFGRKSDLMLLGKPEFRDAQYKAENLWGHTQEYHQTLRALEESVTGFALVDAFAQNVFLKTGDLSKPMDALEACLDELVTHWGVDVEAHKNLSRRARPASTRWFPQKFTYPRHMLTSDLGERLRLRVDISEEGEVTGCHLQMSISDEAFRQSACKQFDKVKFLPALDANGQPIKSYFRQTIIYQNR